MVRPFKKSTAAAVLALALGVSACGSTQQEAARAADAAAVTDPVDPATAGSVTGRISFEGAVPRPTPIKMASDPICEKQGAAVTETIVVGADGGLKNVFVYVKDGLGNVRFPVPAAPVVLDQKGCRYVPHVFGVRAGQPIEIISSDPTLHNIHAIPQANREFNTGQPVPGVPHRHTFSTNEVMVPFTCDVHRWMSAYVGVLDHPFYSVTSEAGDFELRGLPPGTYTIEAWHEKLGTQTQTVTIAGKEARTVQFSFKAT
ncbi:MAG TPA: carboxypeptidase regulatory-like domain-containing protein [Vicinamibacterales bacterium]